MPGSRSKPVDDCDVPMYPAAAAARLAGVTPARVRRWVKGYDYTYAVGQDGETRLGHQGPVVRRAAAEGSSYASFLDLVDLLFVQRFLEYGVSLQRIRKALAEAEEILGGHHFAQRSFFTDGRNIYLQVKNEADALLELLSGGQWVIAPVIKELAHQIEFHQPTGLAQRWYPLGARGHVVVDPRISFGQPSLVGRGVPTANVYDFYQGEQENTEAVSSWMGLPRDEVDAAVAFERHLMAA